MRHRQHRWAIKVSPGADRLNDDDDDDDPKRNFTTGRAKKAPAMVNPEIDEVDESDGKRTRSRSRSRSRRGNKKRTQRNVADSLEFAALMSTNSRWQRRLPEECNYSNILQLPFNPFHSFRSSNRNNSNGPSHSTTRFNMISFIYHSTMARLNMEWFEWNLMFPIAINRS